MDRDRLKEVHQTDLTESRVNEEFVDWLKNKGPTWLLVVLIAICAYLAIVRFREGRADFEREAWQALFAADLPSSYEDVANDYEDVGGVASLARLNAARRLLRSVQSGMSLAAAPPPPDPNNPAPPVPQGEPLTDAERTTYLTRAEGLYQAVLEGDDGDLGGALFAMTAMNGLAAIAECRGDVAAAKQWYERAADRAGDAYPVLAQVASARASNADRYTTPVEFPAPAAGTQVPPAPEERTPVRIEPAFRDLIMPDETSAG